MSTISQTKKPMVIVRFCSKQNEWPNLEGIDIHNKNPRGQYRRYRMNNPAFRPFTFAHMIADYVRHPEAKSLGPDGKSCAAETRGLLQRAHITAGRIRYIDKETTSMWAEGDDLSVVTDNEETGFRVIEYGKGRKVILRNLVKHEMRDIVGLRELRRRGIGQHTAEKALHSTVRLQTYRKILSAIEDYKAEHRG